jgi:hypothetical protein
MDSLEPFFCFRSTDVCTVEFGMDDMKCTSCLSCQTNTVIPSSSIEFHAPCAILGFGFLVFGSLLASALLSHFSMSGQRAGATLASTLRSVSRVLRRAAGALAGSNLHSVFVTL